MSTLSSTLVLLTSTIGGPTHREILSAKRRGIGLNQARKTDGTPLLEGLRTTGVTDEAVKALGITCTLRPNCVSYSKKIIKACMNCLSIGTINALFTQVEYRNDKRPFHPSPTANDCCCIAW